MRLYVVVKKEWERMVQDRHPAAATPDNGIVGAHRPVAASPTTGTRDQITGQIESPLGRQNCGHKGWGALPRPASSL